MSLKFRRFLYLSFILIFLIITPLICFYAAGYKINPKKSSFIIQKTGMFIFNTNPKGAKIYLNGKAQQLFFKKIFFKKNYINTPAKIKNLLPGEYDIKIELPGYWAWEKKLTVHPGQATFAEDIYLFKNDLPLLTRSGTINNVSFSPNKKYLLILNPNNLSVINLEKMDEKNFLISTSTDSKFLSTTTTPSWSPKNQKIIINHLLFSLDDWQNPIFLNKLLGGQTKNFKWNINDDNKIYYSSKTAINYYDLTTDTNKIIIKNQASSDYLPKNDYFYLIKQTGLSAELNILDHNNNLLDKINLPNSRYGFLHPHHKLINLYDQKHQILYLINPLAKFKPLRETINNVNKTYWINDNKLLYANDFEIWILDLENLNKTLLTRISKTITNVIWHPSNNYIIYSTDTTINAIELDKREKYNITEIIKLDKIAFPVLNQKGDTLYFYAKIGNQEGLYKLAIH